MTQALLGSRKRVRSNNCEEECCDFMPLSKRINNLHINNGNCCSGLQHLKHSVTKQDGIFEPSPGDWGCMGHGGECLELNGNEPLCHQTYRNENDCHTVVQSTCIANSDISHQPQQSAEASGGSLHPTSWMTSHYNPALDASDNPYYYESNKLLFALYMERLHRNGNALY